MSYDMNGTRDRRAPRPVRPCIMEMLGMADHESMPRTEAPREPVDALRRELQAALGPAFVDERALEGSGTSRLFVVAPTLEADGIKDKGKTTRVDLSLK